MTGRTRTDSPCPNCGSYRVVESDAIEVLDGDRRTGQICVAVTCIELDCGHIHHQIVDRVG
jgi:hypothetical protein